MKRAEATATRVSCLTQPEVMTAKQLAARFQCSERTLRERRRDGRGPGFIRVGKEALYPVAEVFAYEKEQLARSRLARMRRPRR